MTEHAAGLQVDEAIAQRPVLSERQGSEAGIARAHAGDCKDTGALWLPANHVLLKREGWQLGKNQMYRLYSEEQLQLRSKLPGARWS